jgi:succinate dehydrogenase / fumarate reductase cytochrome b subunit
VALDIFVFTDYAQLNDTASNKVCRRMKTRRPVYLNLLKIKLPVTAILSILHRITGVFMVISIPFLVYLFEWSLQGPKEFDQLIALLGHPLIRLIVALYIWFLAHHLLAGIRFLLIDIDVGVHKSAARASAYAVNTLGVMILAVALFGAFTL